MTNDGPSVNDNERPAARTPSSSPNLESEISNPKSQISNLKSQVSNIESPVPPRIPNPQSAIRNPQFFPVVWPYLVLFLLFFSPVLKGGMLAGGDIINQYLPWKEFWRRSVWQGHWPLWDPLLFCGMPFQANIQVGQFYPLNWLFLLIPAAPGYTVAVLLHFALGAWGMDRLARRLVDSRGARFAAATVFFFTGYFISRIYWGVVLFVMAGAWTPWILDAAIALTNDPRPRRALRLAALLAMQLFSGAPQILFYTLLAVALWLPFGIRAREKSGRSSGILSPRRAPVRKGYRNRALLGLFGAVILFVLLSLVQIWPTWEYTRASFNRAGSARWEFIVDGSMSWRMALTQFAPYLFFDPREEGYYWGAQAGGFHEVNAYAGWLAYLLAFVGFVAGGRWAAWRERTDERPIRRVLIYYCRLLIPLSAILSFGGNSLVFRWFYDYVPGFNLFRDPARIMMLGLLALSLLAAVGWEAVLGIGQIPSRARRRARGSAAFFAAASCVVLAAMAISWRPLLEVLDLRVFHPEIRMGAPNRNFTVCSAGARVALWTALVFAVAAGAVAAIGLMAPDKWGAAKARRVPLLSFMMGALLIGELLWYGSRFIETKTAREFAESVYPRTPLVQLLESRARDDSRVLYDDSILDWRFDQNQQEISCCRTMMRGIPQLRGYNPMLLRPYVEFSNLWWKQDPLATDPGAMLHALPPSLTRLFDVWNARTILSYAPLNTPGLSIVERFSFPPDPAVREAGGRGIQRDLLVYDNANCLGGAWLAAAFDATQTPPSQVLSILEGDKFDLRNQTLVQSGPVPPRVWQGPDERVEVVARDANSLRLRVRCTAGRLLVVPTSWFRGWRARIDGQTAPVLRVNHAMMGVAMPEPGKAINESDVVLYFLPSSFVWGGIVSLAAWLGWVGAMFWLRRHEP